MRFVLREDTTRDAIDDAAIGAGLLLLNVVPASATHPLQLLFASRDGSAQAHVVEDARLGELYVVVQGPAMEACSAALRAALPVCDEAEIRTLVELPDGTDGRVRGIVRLGLTAPEGARPWAIDAIKRAGASANARVRAAAQAAAACSGWSELALVAAGLDLGGR